MKTLVELEREMRNRKAELYLPNQYEYNGYASACGDHADQLASFRKELEGLAMQISDWCETAKRHQETFKDRIGPHEYHRGAKEAFQRIKEALERLIGQ